MCWCTAQPSTVHYVRDQFHQVAITLRNENLCATLGADVRVFGRRGPQPRPHACPRTRLHRRTVPVVSRPVINFIIPVVVRTNRASAVTYKTNFFAHWSNHF
jgi:hypothetical protein